MRVNLAAAVEARVRLALQVPQDRQVLELTVFRLTKWLSRTALRALRFSGSHRWSGPLGRLGRRALRVLLVAQEQRVAPGPPGVLVPRAAREPQVVRELRDRQVVRARLARQAAQGRQDRLERRELPGSKDLRA